MTVVEWMRKWHDIVVKSIQHSTKELTMLINLWIDLSLNLGHCSSWLWRHLDHEETNPATTNYIWTLSVMHAWTYSHLLSISLDCRRKEWKDEKSLIHLFSFLFTHTWNLFWMGGKKKLTQRQKQTTTTIPFHQRLLLLFCSCDFFSFYSAFMFFVVVFSFVCQFQFH